MNGTTPEAEAPIRSCCFQRHYGLVCPDNFVMCCICFQRFPIEELSTDDNGQRFDVCQKCAIKDNDKVNRKNYNGYNEKLPKGIVMENETVEVVKTQNLSKSIKEVVIKETISAIVGVSVIAIAQYLGKKAASRLKRTQLKIVKSETTEK